VAVLRDGQVPPVTAVPSHPLCSPYKIGCKVVRLYNSCSHTHSMTSNSWCQITPLSTQSRIMSSGILVPQYRCDPPLATPKLLQIETPLVGLALVNWSIGVGLHVSVIHCRPTYCGLGLQSMFCTALLCTVCSVLV